MKITINVPLYNESGNVPLVTKEIHDAMKDFDYEIVLVDDGSKDSTWKEIQDEISKSDKVIGIRLMGNFGQTAAWKAGIDHANGDIICFIDGDLQNPPSVIPEMLKKLQTEDLDVVIGWRKKREELLVRSFTSKIGNFFFRKITGLNIHDTGCALKMFKIDIARKFIMYGFAHRFLPYFASVRGARVGELIVPDRRRTIGESKYKNWFKKPFETMLDMIYLYFILKIRKKSTPIRIYGGFGALMMVFGTLLGIVAIFMKYVLHLGITQNPISLGAMVLFMSGVQFFGIGIVAELVHENSFRTGYKPYEVREVVKR
ncbi:MAG: glycosyltransferase [Patescibacteria group bacterium]